MDTSQERRSPAATSQTVWRPRRAWGIGGAMLAIIILTGACVLPGAMVPTAGRVDRDALLMQETPAGAVNLAGGNLHIERVDLSIDTQLGTREIGASYASATGHWHFGFDIRYRAGRFLDPSGAVHQLGGLGDDVPIPGTRWSRLDDHRIVTRGGLVHTFSPTTGVLERISWRGQAYPHLRFESETVAGRARVVRVVQCMEEGRCGEVFSIAHDPQGCVSSLHDRAGRSALFENDAACRILVARDGLDVESGWPGRRYEYEAAEQGGRLRAITRSEGERVEVRYEAGRVVEVRARRGGHATPDDEPVYRFSYAYNSLRGHYVAWMDGPLGRYALVRHDQFRRVLETENGEGERVSREWDGLRPVRVVDAAGVETHMRWAEDELVELIEPSGNVVISTYAMAAQNRASPMERALAEVRDALGVRLVNEYDELGLLVATTNGEGERTELRRNPSGQLYRRLAPDGSWVILSDYGEHGHPRQITSEAGVHRLLFDEVGNRITGAIFEEGVLGLSGPGVGLRTFDADRNIRSVEVEAWEAADGGTAVMHTATLSWRSDGRIRVVERPYGGRLELLYNGLGHPGAQGERVDGEMKWTSQLHDDLGRLVEERLPNGMQRRVRYDRADRPIEIVELRDGVVEGRLRNHYEAGRLVAVEDERLGGIETIEYDDAGRIRRTVHAGGEATSHGYDLRSRETSRVLTLPGGSEPLLSLGFAYDGADREVEVSRGGETVLARRYQSGRLVEISYGNGTRRSFIFDPLTLARTGSAMSNADGLPIEETTVEWSGCAEWVACLAISSYVGGNHFGSLHYEGYALSSPMSIASAGLHPGARLRATLTSGVADVLARFQAPMDHDALGNWTGSAAGNNDGRRRFVFNAERNRLLEAEVERSGEAPVVHHYDYDEAGQLIARDGVAIGWDAGGRLVSIGDVIALEWDGLGRLVRVVQDGVLRSTRFGGEVLADASGAPLALDLGEVKLDLAGAGAGDRYRHMDFRGNVRLVTDASGEPIVHYEYGGYGISDVEGDASDGVSFAQGRALGDFLVLGARVYDPEVGRFLSPDPMFSALSSHVYALGNPVALWDPDGMYPSFTPADLIDHAATAADRMGDAMAAQGNFRAAAALYAIAILLRVFAGLLRGGNSNVGLHGGTGDSTGSEAVGEIGSEMGSLGCSPELLATGPRLPGLWWPILALQLLLALLLFGLRRRDR